MGDVWGGSSTEVTGTQSAMIYIGRLQATMTQWMALQPIFEVYAGGKVYEGGGHRREAWWIQEAIEHKLQAKLTGVLREANMRRRLGEIVTQ